MRRLSKSLALSAAIVIAGCMAAGCGSTAKNAIGSLPTRSAGASPSPSASSSPSPSASISPSPSVTAPSTGQPSATHSATPAQAPQPSSSPAPGTTSASGLIWLWILLGAILLIGVILWIARARGRRSAAAAGWQSRVIDAYAKGSALHDAMSVAESPGALAADDAGARWSDIQRRADDLAQALHALREAARESEDRARVADALGLLQSLRSAMEEQKASGGADAGQAEMVRARLDAFEVSLRRLRSPEEHLW